MLFYGDITGHDVFWITRLISQKRRGKWDVVKSTEVTELWIARITTALNTISTPYNVIGRACTWPPGVDYTVKPEGVAPGCKRFLNADNEYLHNYGTSC